MRIRLKRCEHNEELDWDDSRFAEANYHGAKVRGHENTHKHKCLFDETGVRRFTAGYQPQGHFPRLISDWFGRVFRRSGIRGILIYCWGSLCSYVI